MDENTYSAVIGLDCGSIHYVRENHNAIASSCTSWDQESGGTRMREDMILLNDHNDRQIWVNTSGINYIKDAT